MAATEALHLSKSGRAAYVLIHSAAFMSFATMVLMPGSTFLLLDIMLLTISLLTLAVGVWLFMREQISTKLGWWVLLQPNALSNISARIGYGLVFGATFLLWAQLMQMQVNTFYRFERSIPYIVIGLITYIVGWLLVLSPWPKRTSS